MLPVAATPVIRPPNVRVPGRHPVGPPAAPSSPRRVTNCRKLSAYQCHSSVIRGRRQKLRPNTTSESARTGRAPKRSIARPRSGAENPPTAAKESDALISVRVHPKVSSIGTMNSPNAYLRHPHRDGGGGEDDRDDQRPAHGSISEAWSGEGDAMLHHGRCRRVATVRPRHGTGNEGPRAAGPRTDHTRGAGNRAVVAGRFSPAAGPGSAHPRPGVAQPIALRPRIAGIEHVLVRARDPRPAAQRRHHRVTTAHPRERLDAAVEPRVDGRESDERLALGEFSPVRAAPQSAPNIRCRRANGRSCRTDRDRVPARLSRRRAPPPAPPSGRTKRATTPGWRGG